ncbi:response regulator transcription factor [Sphingomonas sp. S2-65]|uniref:response regulator transcription factor n=1 Tax=Sphingomonas sp. S2-65 TaxID=2903960 RepID=UPI001F3FA57B|nr:response regulator [Sphingomonas sp. S2-65]UYY58427.1 response regulator [Sphingomonas sp. S2-65]
MKHIYVVDDDTDMRNWLRNLILEETEATAVECFEDGRSFLAAADHLPPGLVILDIRLPQFDGLDVLRTIRRGKLRFSVIFLTRHGSTPIAVEAMKEGAVDFLEKPVDPELLLGSIAAAWQKLHVDRAKADRAAEASAKMEKLSPREKQVLHGLMDGLRNKDIALRLEISPRTVEIYRAKIMDKLEARTFADAVFLALQSEAATVQANDR